jgi:outer membrane protein assembly factor BamB
VYTRAFLTRHGGRLLILGWERALDPHGHKKAENSRIEILDLGMPPKADGFGFLTSSKEVGELYIKELGVQMATAGATIVAAAKNEFYRMNWDLQVTEVLEGNFDPQGLSLDEAGNTYMALAAGGTNHVWKLTPKGEIAYDFTLPGPGIVLETPPIVGYDHTVYQLASQQIYAIGDNGKLRWSRTAEGGVGGAAITGDGHLLVSEGSCIVAYDAKGDRRKVHCFPNETLTSPPILNESGNLMVTSKTSLHCLQGVGK